METDQHISGQIYDNKGSPNQSININIHSPASFCSSNPTNQDTIHMAHKYHKYGIFFLEYILHYSTNVTIWLTYTFQWQTVLFE